jgi:hypothetical protein
MIKKALIYLIVILTGQFEEEFPLVEKWLS